MRKLYFLKRNKVCDFSLLLGLVGLILVVIDSELTALEIISKVNIVFETKNNTSFWNL